MTFKIDIIAFKNKMLLYAKTNQMFLSFANLEQFLFTFLVNL